MTKKNEGHQRAMKHVRARLGRELILKLHEENHIYDALAMALIWTALFTLMYLLGTLSIGWVWFCCFILQGFILQLLGFCSHDLFTHRQVGGPWIARLCSVVCLTPLAMPATAVKKTHLEHHRYFGVEGDSEEYKSDLDRRWVKLIFLTFPGILLVTSRKFSRQPTTKYAYMGKARYYDSEIVKKISFEQQIIIAFFVCLLGLAFIWPGYLLLGYFLPLLFAFPLASTLRTLLEHADIQPHNPFNKSTHYKTGPITRLLFFWDSGDCHTVHHFFPAIPFYRINAALKLMNPIFSEQGVIVHKSIAKIIYGWFIENRAHGTNWSKSTQLQRESAVSKKVGYCKNNLRKHENIKVE